MLHALLTILKILGILILAILGIILAVVLLVLLVPIRYGADVSFDGKPNGKISVSWLLRMISVQVQYDGKIRAIVKLLWIHLFDKTVWPSEEEENLTDEAEEFDEFAEEEILSEIQKPAAEPVKESTEDISKQSKQDSFVKPTSESNESAKKQKAAVKKEVPKETAAETGEEIPKKTFSEKIQEFMERIIKKITDVVHTISNKKQVISSKIDQAMTFVRNEANQNTFKLILRQIRRFFKHILPRKLTGHIRFGFDDPYTTGQILTYISPFYGVYAKQFTIEPVFGEKVMEGEVHLKGRIRLGSLIWIAVRILFDKNFRKLIKSLLSKKK